MLLFDQVAIFSFSGEENATWEPLLMDEVDEIPFVPKTATPITGDDAVTMEKMQDIRRRRS